MNMKLFSPEALRAFKTFCEIDSRTTIRPAGAADGIHDPRIRRALNRRVAYDQAGAAPDQETINSILEVLRGTLHDDAVTKIMKALDGAWPGCCGELHEPGEHANADFMKDPAEDEAEEDWATADEDSPPSAGRGVGGPRPFRGMPKRGGGMVGDAALRAARRVSVGDGYPAMMNGNCDPPMAFDSAAEDDYERLFPGVAARIGLL